MERHCQSWAKFLIRIFQFDGLSRRFPLKNFFVLRGLNHDFNISLPFLQEYGFLIDLQTNTLNFENESQVTHIPFVSKFKVSFSVQRISPMVPKKGISIKPRQQIVVKSSGTMDNSFFVTREPDFSPKQVRDLNQIETDPDPEPWEVTQLSEDPTLFQVQNCSEITRQIYNNFRLGSLCTVLPPNSPKHLGNHQSDKQKLQYIESKVKVEEQFSEKFQNKLEQLLFKFNDVISFNGEPGLTTLGETFIVTPHGTKPVYCQENPNTDISI